MTDQTQTETQAMCEGEYAEKRTLAEMSDGLKAGNLFPDLTTEIDAAIALLTRQQEEIAAKDAKIAELMEAAKGSLAIVNIAKGEAVRRDRQIQLLSAMIRADILRLNPKLSDEEIDRAIASTFVAAHAEARQAKPTQAPLVRSTTPT